MAATMMRLARIRSVVPSCTRASSGESAASSAVPYRTLKDDELHEFEGQNVELPQTADVVLVGGGVAGCALAYYLGKFGLKKVVLLEKHRLTSGSTWMTNALLWHLRPSDLDIRLIKRTWDLVKALPKESGVDTNAVQNGGLFIASSKQRLEEYKRLATIGRAFGIESSILSPNDTKLQFPLLHTDDLYGTLYCPTDGSIDAAGYCSALTRSAIARGLHVANNCAVTRIVTEKNERGVQRIVGVETTRGRIKTERVVACAGVWTPYILKPLGVDLPILNVFHSYVVTGAIKNLGAMPNIRDHDGNVAMRAINNYVCLGGYEPDPPLASADDVKTDPNEDTAFKLSNLDLKRFGRVVEAGIHRLPMLREAGIKNTVCGFEAFTPDHKPLIGPVPNVRGLFVSTAFNSSGIMLSGGCAHELAKWVVHGSPELDMFAYDIRRFNPALTSDTRWVTERSHESYVRNYSIVFKNEEPLAGRNRVKDVLYDHLLRDGCIYQERFGWERPAWFVQDGSKAPVLDYDYYGAYGNTRHPDYRYRDFNEQHRSYQFPPSFQTVKAESLNCRRAAALFNVSSIGKFYLVGPDATRAADWLFSNEIAHKAGAVTYSLVLNKRGGIDMDAYVCTLQNDRFDFENQFVTEKDFGERASPSKSLYYYVTIDTPYSAVFRDIFNREVEERGFNCKLKDVTDSLSTLSVQGPNSRSILRKLSIDVAAVNGDFPNLSHKTLTHRDKETYNYRAVRFSRTGEIGWDLHIPTRDTLKFYQWLHQHGRQDGLANAGYHALISLATEKGIMSPHSDVRADDTPFEAGLTNLCKMQTDIEFLGREAMLRLTYRDVPRRLLCFTLQKELNFIGLEGIYRNGKNVGYVRRGDFGHFLNASVAFGYAEKKHSAEKITERYVRDARWQIEKLGTLHDAAAHLISPFDVHSDRLFDSLK